MTRSFPDAKISGHEALIDSRSTSSTEPAGPLTEYGLDTILIWRHTAGVTRVEYHPVFAEQFTALCDDPDTMEIAGEINAC